MLLFLPTKTHVVSTTQDSKSVHLCVCHYDDPHYVTALVGKVRENDVTCYFNAHFQLRSLILKQILKKLGHMLMLDKSFRSFNSSSPYLRNIMFEHVNKA